MRESLRPERVANAIRMNRTLMACTFLLVEGDTDRRLYAKFIDEQRCKIEVGLNRSFVLAVLDELRKTTTPGVLAILDADFDRLEGKTFPADVVLTDTHDAETLLLRSPALDAVLHEHGSEEKLARYTAQHGPLRDVLVRLGRDVGYLRWHSQRAGLALRFEGFDVSKAVDATFTMLDRNEATRIVLARSQKTPLQSAVIAATDALRAPTHDPWDVCCGHDLSALLAHGLKKVLGSHDVAPDEIEKDLRLAFERGHFERTGVFAALRAWEMTNPSFAILAPPSTP